MNKSAILKNVLGAVRDRAGIPNTFWDGERFLQQGELERSISDVLDVTRLRDGPERVRAVYLFGKVASLRGKAAYWPPEPRNLYLYVWTSTLFGDQGRTFRREMVARRSGDELPLDISFSMRHPFSQERVNVTSTHILYEHPEVREARLRQEQGDDSLARRL